MQRSVQPPSGKTCDFSFGNEFRNSDVLSDEGPAEEKTGHEIGTRRYYDANTHFGVISLSPDPLSLQGGVWLELTNTGPMQLIEAVICSMKGRELISKGFVLPQGTSSFFWSLDYASWSKSTCELLIRSEKQLIRRKIGR